MNDVNKCGTTNDSTEKNNGKDVFERFLTYRRRMARMCAVQAIYLYDINVFVNKNDAITKDLFDVDVRQDVETANSNVLYFYKNVFLTYKNHGPNKRDRRIDERYMCDIITATISNIGKIDTLITGCLNKNWTLAHIDFVIRAILRCGVAEILFNTKTDIPILTSEYTNVASLFFGSREVGFVNGIIDRISKENR